jgi:hypothetical protein
MTTAELELTRGTPTPSTSATMEALIYHGPGKRHVWKRSERGRALKVMQPGNFKP